MTEKAREKEWRDIFKKVWSITVGLQQASQAQRAADFVVRT